MERRQPLTQRLEAQRARYVELKQRSMAYDPSCVHTPCQLRLELPMDVQEYLRSIGLAFENITTDEELGSAVSALAVRLYKTDRALNEAIEALCEDKHTHKSS
ncbi:hypothetical protein Ae201684P_001930 [Aphanomyces euteiches]|nr:hypothetical protein Ae201684P_001930 [Aphanomyces euteiches]